MDDNRWWPLAQMKQVVFGRWTLEANPDATRVAYGAVAHGAPELCDCPACRNFAANRTTAYPGEFFQLLDNLGVRFDCEAEIYHYNLGNGVHSYGGCFHFVGLIAAGSDARVPVASNTTFDMRFPTSDQQIVLASETIEVPPTKIGSGALNLWTFDLHSITEQFAAGVTCRTALVNEAFGSQSVLQLEFTAEIPWTLDSPPMP